MKKLTIKINKEDMIKHSPNKAHLSAQIKYHSLVTEDRRKKKPKHKNNLEENKY